MQGVVISITNTIKIFCNTFGLKLINPKYTEYSIIAIMLELVEVPVVRVGY